MEDLSGPQMEDVSVTVCIGANVLSGTTVHAVRL